MITTLKGGKVIRTTGCRWTAGDYVISRFAEPSERNVMQVVGYDMFGQVVTVFVRQMHWKKVPWAIHAERDLLDAGDLGLRTAGGEATV